MIYDRKVDGVEITTATSTCDILSNIAYNTKHKKREVHDLEEWREHMPIAIVGGGPSLQDNLDTLRKYKNIMACGSVYNYLVANNIVPNWCVLCDPDPLIINYITNAQKETKFLVASQCHPEVFDYLDTEEVIIWHAFGDNIDSSVFGTDKILVGGGCTVGTRAMVMAMGFGFNTQHLFGMDTCLGEHYSHHAYEFNDPKVETLGNIFEIKLGDQINPDSPIFKVAGYMLGQFFDFKNLLKLYPDKLDITVIGGGLLDFAMNSGKHKVNNLSDTEKQELLTNDCKLHG